MGTFPALASPFYDYRIIARTGVDLDGSGFVASLPTVIFDNGQTFYYLTAQSQYPATKDPSAVLPQQVFGFLPDFKPVIANSGEIVALTQLSTINFQLARAF